jgi:hypothetical protein
VRFSPRLLARVVPLLVVLVLAGLQLWHRPAPGPGSGTVARNPSTRNAGLIAAARSHASDVPVEASGKVIRMLPDDTRGARHQRFLVHIADSLTILVVHNRDVAPRVPLQLGDSVLLRGEYLWNERGGMIHWTHHDPARRHQPGWIEYQGHRYQ